MVNFGPRILTKYLKPLKVGPGVLDLVRCISIPYFYCSLARPCSTYLGVNKAPNLGM
jgi:hypothetical protein